MYGGKVAGLLFSKSSSRKGADDLFIKPARAIGIVAGTPAAEY